MKRPLGCACLFFVLFIRVFYMCFPPGLPDYSELSGRRLYVNGRILSMKTQNMQNSTQVVYTLEHVQLYENSGAEPSDYISDKSFYRDATGNHSKSLQNTKEYYKKTDYKNEIIYCHTTRPFEDVYLGSLVWIEGTFDEYEAPENPGQFDSQLYYYVQGSGGSLQNAELLWTDHGKDRFRQGLYLLKSACIQKLDACLAMPYSGVMKTILLGDKSDLDKELKYIFQEGGILHILTISGLHISMLGMNTFKLLRKARVPVQAAATIGTVIVLLYGTMTGTGAATFRAIVMFVMQMAAVFIGRTYDRLTGLALAAVLLLLEEPMYVYYSGFLLSFTAVLGVTLVTPAVDKMCKNKGKTVEWMAKIFGGGIGILLASFPVQLYFYFEYPLYSVLVNVLVLPLLPFVVGFGAVVLAIPQAVLGLAVPFSRAAEMLLWGYRWICEQSRKLPFHCLVTGAPKPWQIGVYYGIILTVLVILQQKDRFLLRKRAYKIYKWYPIISIFMVVIAFCIVLWRPVSGLECTFLSVGQGDSAVVRYGKEVYVIDCGSSDRKKAGTDILVPCLKYYGCREVDAVFLSHGDADHVNGILEWLENYEHSHVKIKRLILPELAQKELVEEFAELLLRAEKHKIPVTYLGSGDQLDLGKLKIQVLHPRKGTTEIEDANGYSQVLLWKYAGNSLLFTGDIGSTEERMLHKVLKEKLGETNLTVLKVAHHGSGYSSSEQFIQNVRPEHAVLSYGVGNRYGHPHAETVERLEQAGACLWYTGRHGAVIVEFHERMKIYGFKFKQK